MAGARVSLRRKSLVLGRWVPVKPGNSPVYFAAGRTGLGERGTFNFWTVVFMRKKWPHRAAGVARAKSTILDPGERFRRDPRSLHKRFFDETRPLFLRPSTRREISLWMGTHLDDARYVPTLRRYQPFLRRKAWVERWLAGQEARDAAQA